MGRKARVAARAPNGGGTWSVLAYALVPAAVCVHVFVAPYTKVEESQNVQAVHDLMYHGFDLEKYDYKEFPGVVPRTFIGAILTAVTAAPFTRITLGLNLPKLANLYVARLILGLATSFSFIRVQQAVSKKFGKASGMCFGILQACQFHLPFYSSRFLPNTYALVASNLGLACLVSLEDQYQGKAGEGGGVRGVIMYLTFGAAVFRCDLVLLIIPVALALVLRGKIAFTRLVATGCIFSVASVVLTVGIDSVFWGRLLWPELEVFLFNNPVDNRSAQWGVASTHWYFTNTLPRTLSAALVFVFIGLRYERRTWALGLIALAYLLLYSLLPHKETRFIFPVLPYLNVVGATGMSRVFAMKGLARRVGVVMSLGLVLASLLYTCVSSAASSLNYPGGEGFTFLHEMAAEERDDNVAVHIDVLPAMTGVSRFGEEYARWTYSKEADLVGSGADKDKVYRYRYMVSASPVVEDYDVVKEISGFAGIGLPRDLETLKAAVMERGLPLVFRSTPQVYIHRKRGPT